MPSPDSPPLPIAKYLMTLNLKSGSGVPSAGVLPALLHPAPEGLISHVSVRWSDLPLAVDC